MDLLTLVVLAILAARLCGCRDLKSQALLPVLILIPELDRAARWLDVPLSLEWPWALLHSAVVLLPIALMTTGLHWLGWRRMDARWTVAIALALAAHALADAMTEHGVSWLWPWVKIPTHLDTMPDEDPIIWAIGALMVAIPFISNLVSGEIGAKKGQGSGSAWFALVLLFAYTGYRSSQHDEAVARLMSLSFNASSARRAAAYPIGLSFTNWRAIVDNGEAYYSHDISLDEPVNPVQFRRMPKSDASAAIRTASANDLVQAVLTHAHFPLWTEFPVRSPIRATEVDLRDFRISAPPSTRHVVQCRIFPNGQLDDCEYREK